MKALDAVKFIYANKKFFPSYKTDLLINKLINNSTVDLELLHTIKFISPIKVLMISIMFGVFGIDRFFIGDYRVGFIKLFTVGGFGFLLVFDWFCILKRVKYINYLNLLSICYYHTHIF